MESENTTKMKELKLEDDTRSGDTQLLAITSHNESEVDNASSPPAHENPHDDSRSKTEMTRSKTEEKKSTGYVFEDKEPSEDDDDYDKEKGQPKPQDWEKDDGMRGDKYHPPGSWYLGEGVWIEPSHPLY